MSFGSSIPDKQTVTSMAKALEKNGRRVLSGINGDYFVMATGDPLGIVITDGVLRSSASYLHAIGFNADGSAVIGTPNLSLMADFKGQSLKIADINKIRTNTGFYLFTDDFGNTTKNTQKGVDVILAPNTPGDQLKIGGTVSCTVEQVIEASGATAIVIADNSVMTVNISVDDRNRQYIETGMELMLNDWNGNSYMGIVDSIAVIGENQNGVTVYPGTVRVENPNGTLMGGYPLDYQFTAAQSQDCIVIPIQDVRYYSPEGAEEPQAVVFIQTAEAPENAIDKTLLPADMQAEIPKDCYVIPVETGLSDETMVEIKSGLNDGDKVYNNTPKENYYGRKASTSTKAG